MSKRQILFLFNILLFFLQICATTSRKCPPLLPQPRIVGGAPSRASETLVALFHSDGAFRCSGVLISPGWVLTARHCNVTDVWSARVGSAHLGSGGTIHEIKSTQSPTGEHGDISAIEIRPPKKMKAGGFPLVMTSMKHPVAGSAARVVGYGRILPETRGNERLREVDVPVLRREVCGRAYGGGIMSVQRVCAGYMAGGCDACSGDSGGPMVQFAGGREILVGIVSTGKGCAERGFPGIYTRVGGFMGGFERGGVEFQGVREIEGGEGEEDDGEDIHEDEEEGGVVSVIVEEDGEEDVEVVEEVEEVEEEDDSSNATVMVERNVETASLRIPIWPILAPVGVVALSSIILIQM